MTTATVTFTARELAILQGGLIELTTHVMPLDKELNKKLQAALDSIPNKPCLKWCCVNSTEPSQTIKQFAKENI